MRLGRNGNKTMQNALVKNFKMTAEELVNLYGDDLIGEKIMTEAMGDYPGGIATIIEIHPDPAVAEIPIQVNNPGWGEIGVFHYETVELVRNT